MPDPTPGSYWQTATQVCTLKELEALHLRDHHGLSDRKISMLLNISRWTVRDRLESADRKIAATRNGEAA